MESSPRGRTIRKVAGDPCGIIKRGDAITKLGQQMKDSAEVLRTIKDNSLGDNGQRGKAIDALRDSIGDSHERLQEAGELYSPVGPVITAYGDALFILQPKIEDVVEECRKLWNKYESLPGSVEPRGIGGLTGPEEGSPEAQAQAKEDADKKAAYDTWEAEAESFDIYYEDWEGAFDDAVAGIGHEMSGKIKDGWWDNWGSDLFEVLNTILSVAGLIVGIICLFTGGWILLLVIGIAALVVTGVRYAHNEASGLDLALAIVGVVPFGKIASVLAPVDELVDAGRVATRSGPLANNLMRLTSGGSADDLVRLMRGMEGLDMGRQLLVSQLFMAHKVQHVGTLMQWGGTITGAPEDMPASVRAVRDLHGYVTEGDQHDA